MIYFDSTATTKPSPEIIDLYNKIISTYWANPSSKYKIALSASNLYDKAKDHILNTFNLSNHECLFTSNATEANNLAIYGICNKYLGENKRIITTLIEHPSVYNVYKDLEKKGFDVVYLSVDKDGLINLEELKKALNKDTILVSIMWVNNIIGTIEPIGDVIEILKDYPRCKLHVDSVQAVGKIKLDAPLDNIDLITISAHKLEGLKGTAVLLYHKKLELSNHLVGAEQQKGLKPGTMDLAGAICCAKAITNAYINQPRHLEKVEILYNHLIKKLKELNNVYLNSSLTNSSKYIINIYIKGIRAETILHYLESLDIYVSIGSACNSKSMKQERAILYTTKDEDRTISSIRISLSHHNTIEEIDILIKALKDYLNKKEGI